jgi:hypothetical protein
MRVSFLTPTAGILAFALLLTLAVHLGRERRAARARRALGLAHGGRLSRLSLAAALGLAPLLLGLAAAQPVVESARTRSERTDAQAIVALDVSRSMLASRAAGAGTRVERASAFVEWLAGSLGDVPVGLAAFNESMLPYVFPTTDVRVLATALSDSLGVEDVRPAAAMTAPRQTTSLDALAAIPRASYFAPTAERRLLVVLTDGETNEIGPRLARAFRRQPPIETIFVRFWSEDERVYTGGVPESGYVPDEESGALLGRIASAVGGRVHDEGERGDVQAAAERILGSGPTEERRVEGQRRALMPYVTLAALLPLGLVLWRRNV